MSSNHHGPGDGSRPPGNGYGHAYSGGGERRLEGVALPEREISSSTVTEGVGSAPRDRGGTPVDEGDPHSEDAASRNEDIREPHAAGDGAWASKGPAPVCGTCGGVEGCEEDRDNPGNFYCGKCWEEYDASTNVSSREELQQTRTQGGLSPANRLMQSQRNDGQNYDGVPGYHNDRHDGRCYASTNLSSREELQQTQTQGGLFTATRPMQSPRNDGWNYDGVPGYHNDRPDGRGNHHHGRGDSDRRYEHEGRQDHHQRLQDNRDRRWDRASGHDTNGRGERIMSVNTDNGRGDSDRRYEHKGRQDHYQRLQDNRDRRWDRASGHDANGRGERTMSVNTDHGRGDSDRRYEHEGRQDHYQRQRDNRDRRWDRSVNMGDAKRSAPTSGAGVADAARTSAGPPKRAKPSGRPNAASTAAVRTAAAQFVLAETEEAYEEAFHESLKHFNNHTGEWERWIDRHGYAISKQAHRVPEGWAEKKLAAAEATLQQLTEEFRRCIISRPGAVQQSFSSSDDDDHPYAAVLSSAPRNELTDGERRFILALQSCPPLDAGYHILSLSEDASKHCYCPCGPKVAYWRKRHKLFLPKECSTKASFEPSDLMNHLRMEGGMFEEKEKKSRRRVWRELRNIYHYATRVYLGKLYGDWHGKNFGHKGLYIKQSDPWKRGDVEERRLLQVKIDIRDRQLEQQAAEKKALEEQLAKEKEEAKHFRELADDHQKMVEDLKTMRDKLNVETRQKEELSDREVAKHEMLLTNQFKSLQRSSGVLEEDTFVKTVTIKVMSESGGSSSGFSLQNFFDDLYKKRGGEAHAVMFADEKSSNKVSKLILAEWNILFDKQETINNRSKIARDQKKDATAVDEGGPSRQFLTDVFKQLDTLSIRVRNEDVKLFENTPSGVMCITDDLLKSRLKEAAKKCSKPQSEIERAIKRAQDYSRAIGRIITHAIAHNQTLPSNSMPNFAKNVMFHGYDGDYEKDDILTDITAINIQGEQMQKWLLDDNADERDGDGNKWTPSTFFAKYIPSQCIHTRKILWGGLREGLTLFGGVSDPSNDLEKGCGLSSMFAWVPIKAIERIYFARQGITVEDLLRIIVPIYGEGEPDPNLKMSEKDKEDMAKRQEAFFNGNFERYLRESAEEDESFLVKFIECATGSNYLPYDEKWKIKVEFNFSLDPLLYPKFHSCTRDIVLPGFDVFFGHYETFKKDKMNDPINFVYNKFSMQ